MARILIIDDDPDMAELLGHMTDILGHEHEYVPNGQEAIEICSQRPPDLVVLDIMLEGTDGWAVYDQLAPATEMPIVFITAWKTGENRLRAKDLQADGFLAKPISHQEYAQVVEEALGRPALRTQERPRPNGGAQEAPEAQAVSGVAEAAKDAGEEPDSTEAADLPGPQPPLSTAADAMHLGDTPPHGDAPL